MEDEVEEEREWIPAYCKYSQIIKGIQFKMKHVYVDEIK